jgi:tetratricopeptide (TPR) repeat protein
MVRDIWRARGWKVALGGDSRFDPPVTERRRELLFLAGVLAVTGLTLLPKFWNAFVYDDLFVFVANDTIHHLSNIPSFFTHHAMYVTGSTDPLAVDTYRPITLTTFTLDSVWSGRSPVGYHFTNLLLHLGCTAMVWAVARSAMSQENRRFAWIAAAWFGLSPWIGEAHIWINGRSDPLCTLFVLASVLVWNRALPNKSAPLLVAAAVLMFASLLCKEVAFGVLPAFWFWPLATRLYPSVRERAVMLLSPAIGAGAYLLVRWQVLGGFKSHEDSTHILDAIANSGLLFFDALRALLIPAPPYLRTLTDSYALVSPAVRWSLVVVGAGLFALVMWKRQKHRTLAWSFVFFAGALAPASLITVLIWPGFGRYLYLPFAGLSVGIVDSVASGLREIGALRKPRLARIVSAALVLYLAGSAVLLHRFVYDFRNDGALYGAAIQAAPEQATGHAYLGMSLINHGHPEVAVDHLRRALELQPFVVKYRYGLGEALVRSGRAEEAASLAEQWLLGGPTRDAPRYFLIIVDAVEPTDPRRAVGAALACLRVDRRWGTCLEKLTWLTSEHPNAEEYREVVQEQLAAPQNASLVGLVGPAVTPP